MAYTILPTFNKTLAKDTPSGVKTGISDANYVIHVTATLDSTPNPPAVWPTLQLFLDPDNLSVMTDNGDPLDTQNTHNSFLIEPDNAGNYSVYIAANFKVVASTSFAIMDDADSLCEGATIFFSSYSGLTTSYAPPILPIDENGIIQLNGENPYINVGLPANLRSLNSSRAQAALLVNGTQFVSSSFEEAYNEGFRVPVNMLNEDTQNRFGYTIVNGDSSISPVTAYANVEGEIITRPPSSPLRTLTESPYLLNHASAINDASRDATVYIDYPLGNPDGLAPNDTINVTVYINGWFQNSDIPNNTIFSLTPISVPLKSTGSLTTVIPKEKLAGFGMNAAGRAGTIYIDYTLTKSGSQDVSALPKLYYTGRINTVGPI